MAAKRSCVENGMRPEEREVGHFRYLGVPRENPGGSGLTAMVYALGSLDLPFALPSMWGL